MTPACRVCGRLLRSERWAARGIGPVCAKAAGEHTAPRIPTPRPDHHIDGQTELDLAYRQVTLWSL
ncbi:DUF6011 domain-containing protein [Streptomyces sp. NBC_00257]|uniref:DUF6011 domain-containing protein n=1 Tax=unclassified Streptomyces TaxID=2593676 RepID=UPI00225C2315|nr:MULTISPECIES: DUF6011 domain-containing protein [unclassified Streptomyces]MCX5431904.1 DUF6011 domain-containing protein [Streptomyces sp. NBC_00062]